MFKPASMNYYNKPFSFVLLPAFAEFNKKKNTKQTYLFKTRKLVMIKKS